MVSSFLCIDTSAGASVALVDLAESDPVLARKSSSDPRAHAEQLAGLISQVVQAAGYRSVREANIDVIAVGTGPAPFTGLRAGLVTARVLAGALGAKLVGVCSLEALARQALDVLPPGTPVMTVTDARRQEVYWATYTSAGPDDVETLIAPQVDVPAQLTNQSAQPGLVVVGGGAWMYERELSPAAGLPIDLDVAVLARLGYQRLAQMAGGADVCLSAEPLYLRRPDIHQGGPRKRATV